MNHRDLYYRATCALFYALVLVMLRAGDYPAAFIEATIGCSQALNWRGWVLAERTRREAGA